MITRVVSANPVLKVRIETIKRFVILLYDNRVQIIRHIYNMFEYTFLKLKKNK